MIRLDTLQWQRQLVAAIAASVAIASAAPWQAAAQPAPAGPSADSGPPSAAPSASDAPTAGTAGTGTSPTRATSGSTADPGQARGQASAIDPALEQRLEKAIAARQAGAFEVALELLRAVVADAPQFARAWHEIGLLYALHGQLDQARAAFETALQHEPQLLAARLNLAEILRAEGAHAAALGHYRMLAASSEANRDLFLRARKGAAICLSGLGDREAARAELNALLQADPDGEAGAWAKERIAALDADARAPGDVAEADAEVERLLAAGRVREAADLAGQTCREAPSAVRCYRQAVALLAQRDYLGAVAALRAALRVDKSYLPALSAWPTALRKLRGEGAKALQVSFAAAGEVATRRAARAFLAGETLLADQIATAAMERSGPNATLLLCRAQARLIRGDHRRATADFEALSARRPGYDLARSGLAAIAFAEGRLDVARHLADLPAAGVVPMGVELPDGFDANADLRALVLWHYDEVDHRLSMLLDPGVRARQVRPPPAALDVEALRPPQTAEEVASAAARANSKGKGKGKGTPSSQARSRAGRKR